jgi:16S rRNA (cytosine1402-N4)-methyltransferase
MAGHARQILERITPGGRLLGIDRDPAAVEAGRRALAGFGPAATVVQGRFGELGEVAASAGFPSADLVLFDFGISSAQLDAPERGFSFRSDGPLDMRMDPGGDVTAARIVNQYDEAEIERILRAYGEEGWARRVAQFIVAAPAPHHTRPDISRRSRDSPQGLASRHSRRDPHVSGPAHRRQR